MINFALRLGHSLCVGRGTVCPSDGTLGGSPEDLGTGHFSPVPGCLGFTTQSNGHTYMCMQVCLAYFHAQEKPSTSLPHPQDSLV